MKHEPELKSARMRQLEERRARDFNTFLASIEGKAAEQDNYRNGDSNGWS